MTIALQGELGSFHHLAGKHWFGEKASFCSGQTFADVFALLENGQADKAVVAIENSYYGSIPEVYDLLKQSAFPIVGEVSERIHQHLIGIAGTRMVDITEVISQAPALGQCSTFLQTKLPQAVKVEHYDTAAAVQAVKATGDKRQAAIGSYLAATLSGLDILASNIENAEQNYTRFLIIAPGASPPADANKSSLVLQTLHRPGTLYTALGVFAEAGINLTKLQSRPLVGRVWKYQFYIDVESAGEQLRSAVAELENQGCVVAILGEYRADDTEYED